MTMKLFGKDDEYKTFVLSIGNKKNISLGEGDISLGRKDLSLLIRNSNRDFMIANKDKEVLFFKFTLELKCALEKYILEKNKKKDRLKKLKDILEKERLTDKIIILDNSLLSAGSRLTISSRPCTTINVLAGVAANTGALRAPTTSFYIIR
ncbi:hypothetical protein NX82_05805 [Proteus mirabilis]|nr:hypothetical protein NX82_05805 [Proteus mirabilis]